MYWGGGWEGVGAERCRCVFSSVMARPGHVVSVRCFCLATPLQCAMLTCLSVTMLWYSPVCLVFTRDDDVKLIIHVVDLVAIIHS